MEGDIWEREKNKLKNKGCKFDSYIDIMLKEKTEKDIELRNMIFSGWRNNTREDTN